MKHTLQSSFVLAALAALGHAQMNETINGQNVTTGSLGDAQVVGTNRQAWPTSRPFPITTSPPSAAPSPPSPWRAASVRALANPTASVFELTKCSYDDLYTSLVSGLGSFIGNRSIVIHYANKTRITCANFVKDTAISSSSVASSSMTSTSAAGGAATASASGASSTAASAATAASSTSSHAPTSTGAAMKVGVVGSGVAFGLAAAVFL
ncbi:hypothetical protein MRB53_042244 [Persea americana]|nr:hypothetical protein MRB53_042244 [Persea americana]